MRNKAYKIGIDLDGTLAAYQEELIKFNNKNYGTSFGMSDLKRDDCYDMLGGNILARALKLKRFYKQTNSLLNIKPVKGAVEAVKKLKKEGHDLFVVTSRFRAFSGGTQKWLDKEFGKGAFSNIAYSNLLSSYATRLKTAKYLRQNPDFVIEDSPHAAINCAKKGIKVILLNYPWNKDIDSKNITRAINWEEIIRRIKA